MNPTTLGVTRRGMPSRRRRAPRLSFSGVSTRAAGPAAGGTRAVERATGTDAVASRGRTRRCADPSRPAVVGSSPKPSRAPGARVSSCARRPAAGGGRARQACRSRLVRPAAASRCARSGADPRPEDGGRAGRRARASASGAEARAAPDPVAVPSPPSPTCTSTTTTVMLSAPPCSFAASTSRSAASWGRPSSAQDVGHLVDPHFVGEAVGAEQHPVARLRSASSHMSASTSEDTPRALVRMWRCGMDGRLLPRSSLPGASAPRPGCGRR